MNEEYVEDLEEALSKFMKPLDDLPFQVVVNSVYGSRVKEFDTNTPKNKAIVDKLNHAAEIACKNAKEDGIFRGRPNEVGNDMENYVRESLEESGISAQTPIREDGNKQSTGYPDLYFEDADGRSFYYEVKTFNDSNVDTTQRTFYMSPPKEGKSKVKEEGFHLVISFEIEEERRNDERCFYPVGWKLIDPYDMPMQVKHEINSSNRELYDEERIISERKL